MEGGGCADTHPILQLHAFGITRERSLVAARNSRSHEEVTPPLSAPSEPEQRAQCKAGVDAWLHGALPLSFANQLGRLRKLYSPILLIVNTKMRQTTTDDKEIQRYISEKLVARVVRAAHYSALPGEVFPFREGPI